MDVREDPQYILNTMSLSGDCEGNYSVWPWICGTMPDQQGGLERQSAQICDAMPDQQGRLERKLAQICGAMLDQQRRLERRICPDLWRRA
jgi:hypothetical protein